jgi:hypothetical protein
MADKEYRNIWKELDGIHKQLMQLNTKGISAVTSLVKMPSSADLLSSIGRNSNLCKLKVYSWFSKLVKALTSVHCTLPSHKPQSSATYSVTS